MLLSSNRILDRILEHYDNFINFTLNRIKLKIDTRTLNRLNCHWKMWTTHFAHWLHIAVCALPCLELIITTAAYMHFHSPLCWSPPQSYGPRFALKLLHNHCSPSIRVKISINCNSIVRSGGVGGWARGHWTRTRDPGSGVAEWQCEGRPRP